MGQYNISKYYSNKGSRNEVRLRIVKDFSNEKPGTGKGNDASRYNYYVETLNDGNRIYLKRPANLHNGFDFVVCVENINFAKKGERKRNYPKHEDIKKDLVKKKKENSKKYKLLYELMNKIYNCENVTEAETNKITFSKGLPVDYILKILKWMFIEQDIRYWNYSGRQMTWNIVPKP